MNDRERQRLLDAAERSSGTIGVDIPDEISLQGTTVDLTAFVFECKRLDAVPEAEREQIEEMKLALKRERLARKRRIEDEDITREEGEEIVETIRGIDRAITALEGIDTPSYSEQVRREKLESARELRSLVDMQPD